VTQPLQQKNIEPAIPAGKRLQTHASDRSATGIGYPVFTVCNIHTGSNAFSLVFVFAKECLKKKQYLC
jgi:hypothetical protein